MSEMKLNGDPEKINLRSEEIREILGVPPGWIVRWGTTVILTVIGVVFIGSTFFRYPDLIIARSVITSENPPSVIISRANGRITDLMFPEGSLVRTGDTIAVIENPARLNDIKVVSSLVKSFDPGGSPEAILSGFRNNSNLLLGDVQNPFNAFSKACSDYQIFLRQGYHEAKIKALGSEKKKHEAYYDRLKARADLTEKEIRLARNQFTRDSLLFLKNVIAEAEYEKSFSALLVKQQQLENARLDITSTALTLDRVSHDIMELRFEQEKSSNSLREELVNTFNQLVSSLSAWEKNYLLIAPSSGRLTYMDVWSNLQEVKTGDPLFTINPQERGEVFASLMIPFEGIGKVKEGERVNIKLDGYPFMEFGVVEGTIGSISSGSKENGFPAVVRLTRGPVTSYGTPLSFERDLSGIAEITTEEMSLLRRFFNPLKYLFTSKIKATD